MSTIISMLKDKSTKCYFGDNHFLAIVYEQNARILYRYGLKFTHRESIIEDSIQDIFIELFMSNYDANSVENIKYFLFKCFKRKLFKNLGKDKRLVYTEGSIDYNFEILYSLEHDIILKEDSEKRDRQLLKALNKLTSRQKEAIYLKFTNGFDYNEISELLDMSVEACRNLIYRSVKSLKKTVQENIGVINLFLLLSKFR